MQERNVRLLRLLERGSWLLGFAEASVAGHAPAISAELGIFCQKFQLLVRVAVAAGAAEFSDYECNEISALASALDELDGKLQVIDDPGSH